MCLGRIGVVVGEVSDGVALVEFDAGARSEVSTAVLFADGIRVAIGDPVFVSMGMALRVGPFDVEEGGS